MALGLVAAVLLVCFPIPQLRGDWFAGPVFGIVVLTGVLIGELLVPGPAGSVRSAKLTTRRVRDYLPTRHRALLAVLLASFAGLLTPMTLWAASHPAGGSGSILITCGATDNFGFGTVGILPSAIGLPAISVTVLTVIGSTVVCSLVLRKIANRPPVTGGPESEARDTAMRDASAATVFYAWGCLLASSLFTSAMVALVMFNSLAVAGCTNWWLTPMRAVVYLTTAAGGSAFVYLLAKLIKQQSSRQATA
jgi:hypothetical protein